MNREDLCEKCEACGLCVGICPKNAITLKLGKSGFFEPEIDKGKCIGCGRCQRAIARKYTHKKTPIQILCAKIKDKNVLMGSTSGGIFHGFSEYVLKRNGIVYGAVLNGDFNVVHARATTFEERDRMKGSKYVQSYVGNIFKRVLFDLKDNKFVLFCGTPCQVDALLSIVDENKVETKNLITCEIICNGVSSPKLFSKYVCDYIGKKNIKDIQFRFKHQKIKGSIFAVIKKNGYIDCSGYYSELYTSDKCNNDSCYSCRFTTRSRSADITIGDFSRGGQSPISDTFGLSVLLINTSVGMQVWQEINADYEYFDTEGKYFQKRLESCCVKPADCDVFRKDLETLPIKKLLKKYTHKSFVEDLRAKKLSFTISNKEKN